MKKLALLLALFCAVSAQAQTVSNLGGAGSLQFFNDDGSVLTTGMVYIFQAQTNTPVAVYVDSSGQNQQPNPIPLGGNGRTQIWLANGTFVKIVLCSSNTDGAFCAAGHILFSADNIAIGSSGGSGNNGTFTGVFISSTASPATTGVVRAASGDSAVCFRNAAGSTNLCISKDANDQLSWAGGSAKFPLVGAPSCVTGFSQLWSDNSANRWKMCNNGGTPSQVVASGNDISTTDAVTSVHFGAAQVPIGSTAPSTNQSIVWNGTNLVGGGVVYATPSAATTSSIGSTTMATAGANGNLYRFSYYWTQTALGSSCTGNSTVAMDLTYTDPGAGASANANFAGDTITTNGTAGQMIGLSTANSVQRTLVIRAKANTAISYFTTYTPGTGCSPAPQYQVYPLLEQLTVN